MTGLQQHYGPWALIAGASEGTGRAFAERLAAQGYKLILLARREAPLAGLATELSARYDTECLWASVDLADADAADRIAALCGDREVGLFIANAGADPHGTHFLDSDIDNWMALVGRNVMTLMRLCHFLGRAMRARGGGIILVGSGACYGGAPGLGVYAGSKAFDLCLGEALWAELQPHGVDVLNLILGRTDTPELRRFLTSRGAALPPIWPCPMMLRGSGWSGCRMGRSIIGGWRMRSRAMRRNRLLLGVPASSRWRRPCATFKAPTHERVA
ncbi:SDR family NAD(P)-dependent oxidoreductase [Sphingobium scionense]